MKFKIQILEDDGSQILDTGQLPENSKVTYQIDDQEVTIENIVTPPTNGNH